MYKKKKGLYENNTITNIINISRLNLFKDSIVRMKYNAWTNVN